VILPTDIPTRAEIDRLLEHRAPSSVSIYLPTDPASNGDPERIELKTLAAQASSQLREAGAGVRVTRRFEDEIAYLYDDEEFWRYQARSLAAFAAPQWLITFRLPNRLLSQVEVSDRFYLRPLLRTLTFPHVAFVLALAQGPVRVIEVTPDLAPSHIDVDDVIDEIARRADVIDEIARRAG
jgi:release factor family 11